MPSELTTRLLFAVAIASFGRHAEPRVGSRGRRSGAPWRCPKPERRHWPADDPSRSTGAAATNPLACFLARNLIEVGFEARLSRSELRALEAIADFGRLGTADALRPVRRSIGGEGCRGRQVSAVFAASASHGGNIERTAEARGRRNGPVRGGRPGSRATWIRRPGRRRCLERLVPRRPQRRSSACCRRFVLVAPRPAPRRRPSREGRRWAGGAAAPCSRPVPRAARVPARRGVRG